MLFIKSLATFILSPIAYNFNNFPLFLYLIIITTSSHARNYIIFFQSPRSAITSSSLMAFHYYPNHTNTRRARHIPEQTYRRISLWRNVSCSSNPLRNAVTSSSLVAFRNYLTHITQEARNIPLNKHNHCIV